jgi:hypothetical protein
VWDETGRWLYLVEHDLRGLSPAQLASVHRALDEAVRRQARHGSPVRYVQRIYAPDEHRCLPRHSQPSRHRRGAGARTGTTARAYAGCGS